MSMELISNQQTIAEIKMQCFEFAKEIWQNQMGCMLSEQELAKEIFSWVMDTEMPQMGKSVTKEGIEKAMKQNLQNSENCK